MSDGGALYIGKSPAIANVMRDVDIVSNDNCAVLLCGATGTGKSEIAQLIHEHSSRKGHNFVDINCAELSDGLQRSELFGHLEGAFTSANHNRVGLVETADRGTLFLDEIGDMDIVTQCLLLRALDKKTFRRVGESRMRKSDFRLICATNRDLRKDINTGVFRSDLYYRISTIVIRLPALSERREDIPGLIAHILGGMGYKHLPLSLNISEDLSRRRWQGNIRELRHILARAMIFAQGTPITFDHLGEEENDIWAVRSAAPAGDPETDNARTPSPKVDPEEKVIWNLRELEYDHSRRALKNFGGNRQAAADALGVSASFLYRLFGKKGGAADRLMFEE